MNVAATCYVMSAVGVFLTQIRHRERIVNDFTLVTNVEK